MGICFDCDLCSYRENGKKIFTSCNSGELNSSFINMNYYNTLEKPFFAPPSEIFMPVWTFLYIIILITFGKVFIEFFRKKVPGKIALIFLLNLIFNFAFTPLEFGLQNNFLAMIDILLVLGTLIYATYLIFPYYKWVAYLQIPYILWVSFATILQISITYLNS